MKVVGGIAVAVVAGFLGIVVLLGLASSMGKVAGEVAASACPPSSGGAVTVGTIPAGPVAGYSGAQLENAAHIMRAGADLGLSAHGQTVGVMTAMGESSLQVLDRGDAVGPDSRGLFQQRDNGAWGSYADRMDPYISATNFFRALMQVDGWETLPPTIAAHRTQHNADPYHYERHWPDAQEVVAALSTGAPAEPEPEAPATGTAVVTNAGGDVKPHVQAAADAVVANVPGAAGLTIYGFGQRSGASEHPKGLALDFMTMSDFALGDAISQYHIDNWDALGVDYIIFRQRILSSPGGNWLTMEDRGSATANHMDHPHVSYDAEPGTGALTAGGGTACPTVLASDGSVPADGWIRPTTGPLTSGFGFRWGQLHAGLDLAPECESPIWSAGPGPDGGPASVIRAGRSSGYGNLIVLDHGGGVLTRYAHMYDDDVLVSVGDQVTAGQQIARVGTFGQSTGCHLHFEVWVDGAPTDPAIFLGNRGVPVRGTRKCGTPRVLSRCRRPGGTRAHRRNERAGTRWPAKQLSPWWGT